jgi:protein-disulfide isomerase
MANNENWVNDRLNTLAPPPNWKPDPTAALAKLRERDRVYHRRARWAWSAMAASILTLGIFLTPARCALGVCRNPVTLAPIDVPQPAPTPAPVRVPVPQAGVTVPLAQKPAPAPVPVPINFKESGSPTAPITCEIFTDYQCPHCATIYDQIVPTLRAEYVQTGKLKLVHRDLPLPMHAHARTAARYANAAGALGQYEVVVNQIFRTQSIWAQSGDIDAEVAQVLPPDVMERLRALVNSDAHLDDTVAADVAIARQDNLNQTPSLVITYKGIRQVIAPVPPYSLLKSYLDDLLTK